MAKKVLVVDDSVISRKLISSILKSCGFDVTSAENGFDALELFYQDKYDIILTDINMPIMDGFELVSKVRNDSEYKNTPIILLTTEDDENSIKKGIEIGANMYLTKPSNKDDLLYSINKLLGVS